MFTQDNLGAIQPLATLPTRRERGSSLFKLFFTLVHFTTPLTSTTCKQHSQSALDCHTICFTRRCSQMAEFTAHPSHKTRAIDSFSFALAQCVPNLWKTQLYTSFPCQSTLTFAMQHSLAPAFVSSSTTASILPLHPMVHSSTSKHCIEVVLHLPHFPSLLGLNLKSSLSLVCSPSLQLHRWVANWSSNSTT